MRRAFHLLTQEKWQRGCRNAIHRFCERTILMKNHKLNEKNQVKEFSKEEMRSAAGGVFETCYKIRSRRVQYTIGLNETWAL